VGRWGLAKGRDQWQTPVNMIMNICNVRFEVLAAVKIEFLVFWVAPKQWYLTTALLNFQVP
jgi:hypothetical protein